MKNTADFITPKIQDVLFPSKGQVHSHDNMLNLTSHREQLKKDRMAQQTLKKEQTEKSSSCREPTPSADKKAADIKKRVFMNNLIKLCSLGALIGFGGFGLYKGGAFVADYVAKAKHNRYIRHVDESQRAAADAYYYSDDIAVRRDYVLGKATGSFWKGYKSTLVEQFDRNNDGIADFSVTSTVDPSFFMEAGCGPYTDYVKNIAKSSSEQGAVITDLHTHQVVVDFSKKKGR